MRWNHHLKRTGQGEGHCLVSTGIEREENGMREEKEIKEAIKRLKDKRLRGSRDLSSSSLFRLIAMIETLEWVLGDRERLPDV